MKKSYIVFGVAVALASSAALNAATIVVDEFTAKAPSLYPATANIAGSAVVIGVDKPAIPSGILGGGRAITLTAPTLEIPFYDRAVLDVFTGSLGGGRVGALAVDTTAGAAANVLLQYGAANNGLDAFPSALTFENGGVSLNIDFRLYDPPSTGNGTIVALTTIFFASGPAVQSEVTYSGNPATLGQGTLSIPLSGTGQVTGLSLLFKSDAAVDYLIDRISLEGSVVVPEPTSAISGILGSTLLLVRRRKA